MHGRSDHYVPQFILRRFRPQGRGKLFYAEKHAREFTTRGVRRTFCELDGDLLLKGPPAIRQKGDRAVLAEPPEYTTGLRERLGQLEYRWAPAIKRLVETVNRQHRHHARRLPTRGTGTAPGPLRRPVARFSRWFPGAAGSGSIAVPAVRQGVDRPLPRMNGARQL